MVKEQNPLSLRRTMVKPTIGTVRRTTYDLPDARNPKHVYGYELPRDPENAGQVISKWVHATPSPAAMSGRSFIETNRQAVVHGCISAGQNRRFANEHPGIVVRPISKCRGGFVPSKDMTFGIKSKPSEDMWGLMQSRYTSFKNDNTDYPDLSMMKTKGKLPLPRETKSSIGRDVRNWPRIQHSTPFKMKKFKGVRPIMYTQPKARQQEHCQYQYDPNAHQHQEEHCEHDPNAQYHQEQHYQEDPNAHYHQEEHYQHDPNAHYHQEEHYQHDPNAHYHQEEHYQHDPNAQYHQEEHYQQDPNAQYHGENCQCQHDPNAHYQEGEQHQYQYEHNHQDEEQYRQQE